MWVGPLVLVLREETGSNEIYWRGGETYLIRIYADVGTVSWRESHKTHVDLLAKNAASEGLVVTFG